MREKNEDRQARGTDQTMHDAFHALMREENGDRRVRRTRQALHDALHALMCEKRYDAITVQDIIDRANVGRSTFYAHFRDKEDLAVSSFQEMLDALGRTLDEDEAGGPRLLPTRELLRHVQEQQQHLFRNLVRGKALDLLFEKGRDHMSRKLEAQLQRLLPEGKTPKVPLDVVANHLAGTWLNILQWWLDNKMPYTPERMDEIMQQLVMPGVRAALGMEEDERCP